MRPTEAPCANERLLSFVTRSWCDVKARTTRHRIRTRYSQPLKPVSPTCCVVGAVEPGQRRGEKRTPRWLTTQPRQVLTARLVLCARSADTPRGEKRARRAPRDLNAMTTTTRNPCRRPVAVLARSSPGRRRGEDPCLAIASTGSCWRARARAPSSSSGTRGSNELELSLAEWRSAGGSLTTAFQKRIHDAHTN